MRSRLPYVDSARGLACVLAVAIHLAQGQFQFSGHASFGWLTIVIRTATPTFLTVFGIMIAIVYMPRLAGDAGSRSDAAARLASRMITCYAIYGLITLAAVASGKIGPYRAVEAMLWVGNGRYGEIFKIYAGLILLILLLLPLVRRYGFWLFVSVAAAGWALKPLLPGLLPEGSRLLHFVFGYDRGFGPSILGSFTFVAFGVAIGEAIAGRRSFLRAATFVAVAGGMLAVSAWQVGLAPLAQTVADFEIRGINHPIYFAYGIVASAAILLAFAWVWRGSPAGPVRGLAGVGSRSLFFFGFASVAMNLLPAYPAGPLAGWLLTLAFLAGMTLLTLDLERADSRLDRLTGGLLTGFRLRYDAALQRALGGGLPRRGV